LSKNRVFVQQVFVVPLSAQSFSCPKGYLPRRDAKPGAEVSKPLPFAVLAVWPDLEKEEGREKKRVVCDGCTRVQPSVEDSHWLPMREDVTRKREGGKEKNKRGESTFGFRDGRLESRQREVRQ
jgi:hypothetical protein